MGTPLDRYPLRLLAWYAFSSSAKVTLVTLTSPTALCAVITNPAIANSEVECWAEVDGVVVDNNVEGCESGFRC